MTNTPTLTTIKDEAADELRQRFDAQKADSEFYWNELVGWRNRALLAESEIAQARIILAAWDINSNTQAGGGAVKTELWWVSVGGTTCEPARIVREGKQSRVFTIGCPDGTLIDPDCGVELVERIEKADIPLTPEGSVRAERNWQRKMARDRKAGLYHGYRRFD